MARLLQSILGERIEHAEAVMEVSSCISIDLPGKAERDPQNIMHVVCGSAMCQVSCKLDTELRELQVASMPNTRMIRSWRLA